LVGFLDSNYYFEIFVAARTASSTTEIMFLAGRHYRLAAPVEGLILKVRQECLIDYCFGFQLVVRTT
jgi:hypothetical protein